MFVPSFFLLQGFLPNGEDPEAQNSYSSKVMMLEGADAGSGHAGLAVFLALSLLQCLCVRLVSSVRSDSF